MNGLPLFETANTWVYGTNVLLRKQSAHAAGRIGSAPRLPAWDSTKRHVTFCPFPQSSRDKQSAPLVSITQIL